MSQQAVTANRLHDGQVVYLAANNGWSDRLADAAVADDADAAAALLAAAERDVDRRVVVGPYLFDVTVDGAAIRPLGQRETIRAKGPSIRPDLGYQAAQR